MAVQPDETGVKEKGILTMEGNAYVAQRITKGFLIHMFLIIFAVTCLFPLFWMVRSALMTNETVFTDKSLIPQVINFGNFGQAWTEGNFAVYFFNSLLYTTCVFFFFLILSLFFSY